MHSQILKITPELAESWLAQNTFNRPVSMRVVRRYAADMASGSWHLNHQGVAFDSAGVLVDGQHRLHAIIRSGCTVSMMVTWGASRVGVDELRVRSTSEVVKFGGLSDWIDSKAIQVAKAMTELFLGDDAHAIPSTTEVVRFCNKNKAAILFTLRLFPRNLKGISTAASKATIAVAYYHHDHDDIAEFVRSLYSGVVSSPDRSAVIRAREMMLAGEFSGGGAQRKRAAKRLARAVVSFCERAPVLRLQEPKEFPFLIPEDFR